VGFQPAYVALAASGELAKRAKAAHRHLEDCDLCARYCRVNRRKGIEGAVCRTGERAVVASYGAHHGEEDPLRGWAGSGTIFFSWCNLRCMFCQNWDISQRGVGREVEPREIADMMLALQAQGCHNINLVSPSHVVAQIIASVAEAAARGLRVPLVYNTGGYDSPEALALLEDIVDVYMPDMKYGDSALAHKYSKVRNYVEVNRAAVKDMHRQVGDLVLDENGIARHRRDRRGARVPGARSIAQHLSQPDGPVPPGLSCRRVSRARPADHPRGVSRGAHHCRAPWPATARSASATRGLIAS
jgi:putative pyruvate formate lyase activating enzyme